MTNSFRKESFFTQPPKTAEKGADLEVGQTRALPQDPPKAPDLVRQVPSRKDLEDWAWALREAAQQAMEIRGGELLGNDLEEIEARILPYL